MKEETVVKGGIYKECDIDIIITNILKEGGHSSPSFWLEDKEDPDIIFLTSDSSLDKRKYVNRYWRRYLGNMKEDTMKARFCLNDNEHIYYYVDLFKEHVLPHILKKDKEVNNV